jgi:glutamine amidotransferase|tara:strand:+ start:1108 stop:1719 length:612 start_codon:yes stop_codon:yes gene_type:complete
MIGVIDYGAGNLRSVCNSLKKLSVDCHVVKAPSDLNKIETMIFPGVGSFGDSSDQLKKQSLFEPIREWIINDRPFLGICIGFQMLFDSSEESPGSEGLGIIPGKVIKFSEQKNLKVPHMGWNEVQIKNLDDPVWQKIDDLTHFYFVHSYFPKPDNPEVSSSTTGYGVDFTSSIRFGNIFGTQFHPEKSQKSGLRLIENFLKST